MSDNNPSFRAAIWKDEVDDLTTYLEPPPDWPWPSYEGSVTIEATPTSGSEAPSLTGRGLAARCFNGRYLSVSVRPRTRPIEGPLPSYDPVGVLGVRSLIPGWKNGYEASSGKPPDNCIFAIGDVCEKLYKLTNPRAARLQGLILVTGGTNSAKSKVARGLVWKYLLDRWDYNKTIGGEPGKIRRPHLLTVETPIEEYLFTGKDGIPVSPQDIQKCTGIDYTPRQIGEDVRSLEAALMTDALRQTPAVVFVGELRSEDDLATVMRFAETGHLVVSTAHAGSLVETMERVFGAVKAMTADARGRAASRINTLVHLKPLEADRKTAIVPALWRGTPSGIAGVVADGPSSILPHRPGLTTAPDQLPPSLGRTFMVEKLCKAETDVASPQKQALVKNALVKQALVSDIQGI